MRHQKPLLGQQINWTHPLAKGLAGCWVINEGSGNIVYDLSNNLNTGIVYGANRTQDGLNFNSGDARIDVGKLGNFCSTLANYKSYFFYLKSSVTNAIMCPFGTVNDASNIVLQIQLNSNTAEALNAGWMRFFLRDTDGTILSCGVHSDTGITNGNPHTLLIVASGAGNSGEFYVDGVNQVTNYQFQQTPDNFDTFDYPLTLGCRNLRSNYDLEFVGDIYCSFAWNRHLTSGEAAYLHLHPYCFLQQYGRSKYYFVSVGGATVTFTKVAMIMTGKDMSASKTALMTNVAMTATGKNVAANKAKTLAVVAMTAAGKDVAAHKVNTLANVAMILTGKNVTTSVSGLVTLITVAMTMTGQAMLASKTALMTVVSMTATGLSLLANKIASLGVVAITMTGLSMAAHKVNNMVRVAMTMVGQSMSALGANIGTGVRRFFDFF